jgi:hypothetical protein
VCRENYDFYNYNIEVYKYNLYINFIKIKSNVKNLRSIKYFTFYMIVSILGIWGIINYDMFIKKHHSKRVRLEREREFERESSMILGPWWNQEDSNQHNQEQDGKATTKRTKSDHFLFYNETICYANRLTLHFEQI